MVDAHKNFAYSTIFSITDTTHFSVPSGEGARFPATPFNLTVWPRNEQPLVTNAEIIRVTTISGDNLTVTRNATFASDDYDKGSYTRTILVGDQIAATITNKTFLDIEGKPLALTGAAAATRYVGATTNGAPTTGTFVKGDFVIDQTAKIWVCVTAGTPGVWQAAGGGGAVNIGALQVIGHSFSAGTTQVDSGTSNIYQESMIARLQGMLGIHSDNVLHLGKSGSTLGGFSLSGAPYGGVPGALQYILPNNSAAINAAADSVVTDPVVAVGGAGIIVHGVNDLGAWFNTTVADNDVRATFNAAAAKNSYRTIISRMRAGVVFCSAYVNGALSWTGSNVGFTGTWSDFYNPTGGTSIGSKYTTTTGDVVTITIPPNFTGGTKIGRASCRERV